MTPMTTDTADQVITEALDDLQEYAELRKQSYTIAWGYPQIVDT